MKNCLLNRANHVHIWQVSPAIYKSDIEQVTQILMSLEMSKATERKKLA